MPIISNSETSSLEEYTSEEENPTLEPPIPQQVIEETPEQHSEHTDLGEEDLIVDLSQHFDQSIHLKEQPQSSPFNHHQPLPPLPQMSNQPTAAAAPTTQMSELHLGQPNNFDGSSSKASAWIDSVQLYLMINDTLYGPNQSWKQTFRVSWVLFNI